MQTLVLGTRNPDKVRELQELLLGVPLRLVPLPGDVPEAPEDQETLEGNAAQKATQYARRVRAWVLADDTGLEVDALGGAPGVRAARYAGDDATYADNRRKMLLALRDAPPPRTARFRCVVALANPAGELVTSAHGLLEGEITAEARGEGGFGYDPIFLPRGEALTLAELSAEEKHRLSHRARAVEAMRPRLLELL